jgi:ABC-type phosphate transport system substrate-binding protein
MRLALCRSAFLLLAATSTFSTASAAGDITGSTFVDPVMSKWAASHNAKTGTRLHYQSVGSGKGISQIKAGAVTFGASSQPDFHQVITDAPGKTSWPITATVFVLMYKQPKDGASSREAMAFFQWALRQGQTDARSLAYIPLPDALVKQVEAYWAHNIKAGAP